MIGINQAEICVDACGAGCSVWVCSLTCLAGRQRPLLTLRCSTTAAGGLMEWVNTGPIGGLCTCGAEVADGPIPAHESSGGDSDDSWARQIREHP